MAGCAEGAGKGNAAYGGGSKKCRNCQMCLSASSASVLRFGVSTTK